MEAFVEIIKVLFKMGVPPVLQAIIQAAEILSKFIDGQDKKHDRQGFMIREKQSVKVYPK